MWKLGGLLLWVLLISACGSLLPESHTDTSPFKSFEEARTAVLALVPMKSDQATLEQDGFNPTKHPNTTLLTHADVARRFLPSAILQRQDLDPGILLCLESRDDCHGIEIVGAKISSARKGSFWADFLNFQRRTETTGWRFTALVLMVKDLVVYRSWSGQPVIDEKQVTKNPLGPFQDIGPSVVPKPTYPSYP